MKGSPPLSIPSAGAAGLNFLNAISPARHQRVAAVRSGSQLLDWLDANEFLAAGEADDIRCRSSVAEFEEAARDIIILGEWFRSFLEARLGRPLIADDLAQLGPLNTVLAGGHQYYAVNNMATLADGPPTLGLATRRREEGVAAMIQPIADILASLVCDEDFAFIRQCDGPRCTLFFVDRTRAKMRRWCSMAGCGNRVKQTNFRTAQENRREA